MGSGAIIRHPLSICQARCIVNRRIYFLILTMIGLYLLGCAPAFDRDQPPEIRYGEDICDQCGMIISTLR